jgi:flagellar hook-basal body complex protein FliE
MVINPISSSVGQLYGLQESAAAKNSASSPVNKTAQTFDQVLSSLNTSESNTNNLVEQLSSGGQVDLSQVMIGLQENDVNFQVALSIRDKLVDAYREVMRMQV